MEELCTGDIMSGDIVDKN